MPEQSITELRNAIESAPEMTDQHRLEMLALVDSLATEVAEAESTDLSSAQQLREAITSAEDVVRKRTTDEDCKPEGEPDLAERLADLEKKVEMVAIEHPVVANVLAAIGRLV